MRYDFKTYKPFNQRGQNFPDGIVRLHRTSLVVSSDVLEKYFDTFNGSRITTPDDTERVLCTFKVDKRQKVLQLVPDRSGYALQVRQNGNGYLNTTRLGSFGLPIGDYKATVDDELTFELAQ